MNTRINKINSLFSKKEKNTLLSITLTILLLISIFAVIQPSYAAPTAVTGRRLTPSMTGDTTSDWIEIAQEGEYSLILRVRTLSIGASGFDSSSPDYRISAIRNSVNNWFKNTLSGTARLRNFTVANDATTAIKLGGFPGAPVSSLASSPSSTMVANDDDVAFLLNFHEAALFCSEQYSTGPTTWAASSSTAQANYRQLDPGALTDFWWLRTRGSTGNTACSVGSHSTAMHGTVYQSSLGSGYSYVRPALWVKSSIFDVVVTFDANVPAGAVVAFGPTPPNKSVTFGSAYGSLADVSV
ncbi:MAG: DUF6273 domain-containing protein, partial [Nitrososphaerota archaeon]|nr:DUF6273 domain-containing protein [Nitrososphaerota archaeon]